MSTLTRLLTPATTVATVLAIALPTTASAASSTTITACVKTKTGAFKILTAKQAKKKCPKGSKKITWSVKGKNGENGTNGANANGKNGTDGASGTAGASGVIPVHDSAGNLLGEYAGTVAPAPPVASITPTAYNVLRPDGGLYQYSADGRLLPSDPTFRSLPLFRDAACADTAYLWSAAVPSLLSGVSNSSRWVYRPIDSTDPTDLKFGPARAWEFTGATMTVPPVVGTFYAQVNTGACIAIDPAFPSAGQTLPVLRSVPAPPDGVGTIVVG
jgi:hypothetical protein